MKAAIARAGAGIDAVTIEELPIPVPGAGQVLVRLKAATLNFRDLLGVGGLLHGARASGYVPLSCGAGEVVALGDAVTRVKPGDRVSPLFSQGWLTGATTTMTMLGASVDGTAREYAVFDAQSVCLIPDEIGDLEAATLPCAGLTAWSALFGERPLQAGEWILVQGTGGVSLAALQWAKAVGAKVVATSSSDAKLHRAKALGADITINYRTTPDWAGAARAALGGRGVDIVIDVVGTSELQACARVVAEGGLIAAVGRLDGTSNRGKEVGKRLVSITVGNREGHEAMLAFCARHGIRPVVDMVYDLDRLASAMRRLQSGQVFGKLGINLM